MKQWTCTIVIDFLQPGGWPMWGSFLNRKMSAVASSILSLPWTDEGRTRPINFSIWLQIIYKIPRLVNMMTSSIIHVAFTWKLNDQMMLTLNDNMKSMIIGHMTSTRNIMETDYHLIQLALLNLFTSFFF